MQDKVKVLFLSSPFGLKGEIKFTPFERCLKSYLNGFVYVNGKSLEIEKVNFFNNTIKFVGIDSINDIESLLKKDLFIERSLINIDYLYSDLSGLEVVSNKKVLGTVSEVLIQREDAIIRVCDILIPLNSHFFEKLDLNDKKLYIKNIEELI